jgi:hypothetical protein
VAPEKCVSVTRVWSCWAAVLLQNPAGNNSQNTPAGAVCVVTACGGSFLLCQVALPCQVPRTTGTGPKARPPAAAAAATYLQAHNCRIPWRPWRCALGPF